MKIDRAIEILDPDHREHYDGMEEVNEACRMGMEAIKRQKWIPCSAKLPDVNQTKSGYESVYVIATDGKRVSPMIYERACVKEKNKYRWKYAWDRIYDGKNIIAWMPLPEPPEEGENENAAD